MDVGLTLPAQMRVNLASLPVDHPARTTPLEKLETLLARNVVGNVAKDPRTWRVAKASFNALTSAWEFTEWTVEKREAEAMDGTCGTSLAPCDTGQAGQSK